MKASAFCGNFFVCLLEGEGLSLNFGVAGVFFLTIVEVI